MICLWCHLLQSFPLLNSTLLPLGFFNKTRMFWTHSHPKPLFWLLMPGIFLPKHLHDLLSHFLEISAQRLSYDWVLLWPPSIPYLHLSCFTFLKKHLFNKMHLLPLEFTSYCLPLSTTFEAPQKEGLMISFCTPSAWNVVWHVVDGPQTLLKWTRWMTGGLCTRF